MALRIEEDLGMADVVLRDAAQVGQGEIVEILLGEQHRHALVVEVEKILQDGESIGRAQRLDVGVGQGNAVALREGEHHVRLQRAFDVQEKHRLRQARSEEQTYELKSLMRISYAGIFLQRKIT